MSYSMTTTVGKDAPLHLSDERSHAASEMFQDRLAYNTRIETMRKREYPMLKDEIYLDHAGMTLPAKQLMESFTKSVTSTIIGNPHSAYGPSQLSNPRIDDIRARTLQFFDADPVHFDLIFVANATAGVKLVGEALRAAPDGFDYVYHRSSHTSLVGLREEARRSACLDDSATTRWLGGRGPTPFINTTTKRPLLFSYPAQSNMDGSRLPLDWIRQCRSRDASRWHLTLLDAAAYVSTAPLSLAMLEDAPDFTVFSFYKIFGFPNLGGLVVRRESTSHLLVNRKYFGGGTVDATICEGKASEEAWHATKTGSLHDALEDGTLPVHSIIALDIAMRTHRKLFGPMTEVSLHTSYLADQLYSKMDRLRHDNGARLCVLYSRQFGEAKGPIVAFNLLTHTGDWVSPGKFQELAVLKGFHIRTGGVCNPGGIAAALHLTASDIKRNHAEGYRCGADDDIFHGQPAGLIRVSLGAMSTLSDITRFCSFIKEFYMTKSMPSKAKSWEMLNNGRCISDAKKSPTFEVESIMVFPIKSCQGFSIAPNTQWMVTKKGLAWDREWCLLNSATNRVMNQKRCPRMALLRPDIDIDGNIMTITYLGRGAESVGPNRSISLPLFADAASQAPCWEMEPSESRVPGIDTLVYKYASESVNGFFSRVLETPCILARISQSFNGRGQTPPVAMPGTFPVDDDTGAPTSSTPCSLSNESPVLAINMSSVNKLNQQIELAGGEPVSAKSFRANIILNPTPGPAAMNAAYAEDGWSHLRIGPLKLEVLGQCQRCHMVCIDPITAIKRPEPYVTLAKTRRIGGKVLFGCHMALSSEPGALKIGDRAMADPQ